jgi:glycosyltransferase involved in cell wall biosynthesis
MASISFVIPAYNEERLLGRTLRAIDRAAQALGEPVEVIVVDDASSDRTAAIAQEHRACGLGEMPPNRRDAQRGGERSEC